MSTHTSGQSASDRAPSPTDEPLGGLASDVRHYLSVLRRRWWLIVLGGLVAILGAWWQQRGQIDRYTAEVLIQQRAETPVVSLTVGSRVDFGSQVEIIRSRAVMAEVVESLGLQLRLREGRRDWSRIVGALTVDRDPPRGLYVLTREGGLLVLRQGADGGRVLARSQIGEPIEGPGFTLVLADPAAVQPQTPVTFSFHNWDASIERLQRQIRVEPARGSNLIRISITDPDPHLAAAVVNAVAESYQQHRARAARDAASRRGEVIAAQLVELADSLQSVQSLVLDYQRRSQLLNPGAETSAIMSARLETENEIRQLRYQEGLLEALVAGLRGADSGESVQRVMTMAAEVVPSGRALFDRLQALETERSRLTAGRLGYTSAEPQVQAVDSLIASVRSQMQVATEQSLELLQARLASAESRLGQLRYEAGALPGRTAALARYQQRVDAVQDVFDMLVERYYEAQIAVGVEVGDVEVVDPAVPPLRPNPRDQRLYFSVALLMGLFAGAVGAVTVDQLDTRIREPRHAEKAAGLEVLGKLPLLPSRGAGRMESMLVGKEALRAIRTNLHFATSRAFRVLLVTSAEPGEGKSTIAANLALTFAEQGLRTVLVDVDQHRPVAHSLFQVKRSPGLCEVLSGAVPLSAALKTSTLSTEIVVLPAGTPNEDGREALHREDFARLILQLRDQYEVIVIDTPPLLAVHDTVVAATAVDGTLIVARSNVTNQEALRDAVTLLRRVKAPLVGLILNGVRMKDVSYSYYYSYYTRKPSKTGAAKVEQRRQKLLQRFPSKRSNEKASFGS